MEDVTKINLIHLHINRMLGAARVELLRCLIVILKTQVSVISFLAVLQGVLQ